MNASFYEKDEANDTVTIHSAYVKKSFRGKVLEKIKLWVKEIRLPARHLYESMGFKYKDKTSEHTLIMEKA